MKHSIRKEDVTYVVRPEQKKVIAYIEGTQWMFTDFVNENYPGSYVFWCNEPLENKLKMLIFVVIFYAVRSLILTQIVVRNILS